MHLVCFCGKDEDDGSDEDTAQRNIQNAAKTPQMVQLTFAIGDFDSSIVAEAEEESSAVDGDEKASTELISNSIGRSNSSSTSSAGTAASIITHATKDLSSNNLSISTTGEQQIIQKRRKIMEVIDVNRGSEECAGKVLSKVTGSA